MLDGFFLSFLVDEIKSKLVNCYVDKLYHPSKYELILHFRSKNHYKLLLNINSDSVRLGLINMKVSNPSSPTMFCMLMRKYLVNAKLINISQYNFERISFFDFETLNEVGDKIVIRLVIELMGRHSNIILINQNNVIIDSIKKVGSTMSKVRQVLPGLKYVLPPDQKKLNIMLDSVKDIIDKVISYGELNLSTGLVKVIEGVSPILSNEITYLTTGNKYFNIKDLSCKQIEVLKLNLYRFKDIIDNKLGKPLIFKNLDDKPYNFSFIDLTYFDKEVKRYELDCFSDVLEIFYSEKSKIDRVKQNESDLLKILNLRLKKAKNKLEIQKKEKLQCESKDKIKQTAMLLQSNLHNVKVNDSYVIVNDFFNNNEEVKIYLNNKISGVANVQGYFNKYKKLCIADKCLDKLLDETKNEIVYLESVVDNIMRSDTQENLDQIKLELREQGILKNKNVSPKNIKHKSQKDCLFKIKSVDGFDILVGINNINNDWLTFKYAHKNDIWFHAQKIPGAHVIVISNGREVPISTIEQAAKLAVKNSKAKDDNLVSVDYTQVKNVKKFKGAKPGMVIYNNFKTFIVK